MKILITGGEGRLARALAGALSEHRLSTLAHRDLDITDADAVERAIQRHAPDLLINAGAFNDVDAAEDRAEQAYRVNAIGPGILARAAARAEIAIVHFSSDYVFDGTSRRPYEERDQPNPLSVYGKSKLEGELAVAEANPRHFIVRTAWLYDEKSRNYLTTMRDIAISRERLKVVDDQFGSPTYIPHLARAIAAIIRDRDYGLRHLAGSGTASRLEIVELILSALGVRAGVERVSLRDFPAVARRPAFSPLTTSREPRVELPHWRAGVEDFIRACHSQAPG